MCPFNPYQTGLSVNPYLVEMFVESLDGLVVVVLSGGQQTRFVHAEVNVPEGIENVHCCDIVLDTCSATLFFIIFLQHGSMHSLRGVLFLF